MKTTRQSRGSLLNIKNKMWNFENKAIEKREEKIGSIIIEQHSLIQKVFYKLIQWLITR